MRAILFCATFVLLAGCRNGEQSERDAQRVEREAQSTAHARDTQPDGRPVLVAFGDSLTAGAGLDPGKSYPDFLQSALDKAGYRYRVINAGISGDTTSGGVGRLSTVVELKPEIVILELGANDGLRGLPLASTRANLDEIIVGLKRTGAQVVLAGMTLPRNYGPDYIREFERIFTGLAQKHSLPLIPFLLAGVAEGGAFMQPDQLHPTTEGNRRVAANVMRTLKPLLVSRSR